MIFSRINNSLILKYCYLVIFSLLLNSCSTGSFEDKNIASIPTSGFGGTGYKPSGFGGTGIIGTITEFGSIWVNGIEIDVDDNTQVVSELYSNDQLKLGHQVILETLPKQNEVITKKVAIYYPIAGEVTAFDEHRLIVENKYSVKISDATHRDDHLEIKKGAYVAVNGYQLKENSWAATRLSNNPQKKVFFYPQPKFKFSSALNNVLIESSYQQLKQWKELNVSLKLINKNRSNRVILQGKYINNRIQIHSVRPYLFQGKQGLKIKKQGKEKVSKHGFLKQQNSVMQMHRWQRRMKNRH